jgi:hypothetical protein
VRRWGEVRVLVIGSTVEDNDAARSPYNKAASFSLRNGNGNGNENVKEN